MTRKVWAAALIFFMPFAGMRVVCVDGTVDRAAADLAAEHPAEADCERLCPWHPGGSDVPESSNDDSDCAMTAGGASFVVMAATTTLPVQAGLHIDVTVSEAGVEASPLYIEPGLSRLSPPPKA